MALREGREVGLVSRQGSSGAECKNTPASAEYDYSYYTFHIDPAVKEGAAATGLTKIGVLQNCDDNGKLANNPAAKTTNWAYVPLDKFGPENPYRVQVDRCKKRYDRHVASYSVWLCNNNNWCGTTDCGENRAICTETNTKSVDLVDDTVWKCAV
ncbi:uncharacterized protein CTRU02_204132 [Colletotrichum truncatum]|uniref:Uncharacterized protein n=1 Tax=Colletotrichum truncatum TaxID=5467 RepID=A0ACC3ZB29_COLTU|nr:uncharacterized protein CTRU02_09985 [Colletotrichum truncatum]KAF6787690.1 hypothetical protein CTRU02_09985 [Colletotrichum truncatum]